MTDVTSPAGNPLTIIEGDAFHVERAAARCTIIAEDYGAVMRAAAVIAAGDDAQSGHGIDAARALAESLERDASGFADRLTSLQSVLTVYADALHEAQTRIDPLVEPIVELLDEIDRIERDRDIGGAAAQLAAEILIMSKHLELAELWLAYDAAFETWRDAFDAARAALEHGEQLTAMSDDEWGAVPSEPIVVTFTLPDSVDPNDASAVLEYVSQVEAQEAGLRELSVEDWRENRGAYRARADATGSGRDTKAERVPKADARALARAERIDELVDSGMSIDEAIAEADTWMQTQAALHDPDQVAGGDPEHVEHVGDRATNSAIGGGWPSRIDQVDDEMRAATADMSLVDKTRATVNVDLVVVDAAGEPIEPPHPHTTDAGPDRGHAVSSSSGSRPSATSRRGGGGTRDF